MLSSRLRMLSGRLDVGLIPFDNPRKCLLTIEKLTSQVHPWSVMVEIAERVAAPLRAEIWSASERVRFLRVFAKWYHRKTHAAIPEPAFHEWNRDALQDTVETLTESNLVDLGWEDLRDLGTSCVRLDLKLPTLVAHALVLGCRVRVKCGRTSDILCAISFFHHFGWHWHLDLPSIRRTVIQKFCANSDFVYPTLHGMCFAPARTADERAAHLATLLVVGNRVRGRLSRQAFAFTRYLAHLRWHALSVLRDAWCAERKRGCRHRVTWPLLDQLSSHCDHFHLHNKGSSQADHFGNPSSMESDVRRVVDVIARNRIIRFDYTVMQNQFVYPLFEVDFLLTPSSPPDSSGPVSKE
jgi:hypothetical protein